MITEEQLKQLRTKQAQYEGFISRLAGHLRINATDMDERFLNVQNWLSEESRTDQGRTKPVEDEF